MPNIRCGHLSITGNFRDNNEDNYHVDPQHRFFLVADGMGGQSAGEKASQLAIDLISKNLTSRLDFAGGESATISSTLDDIVAQANSEIMALGRVDPDLHNMGTTIILTVAVGESLYIGNVGDSRVYQLRHENLTLITKDHSLTQALIDAGTISEEDAKTHRYKNVLYRYLGAKEGGDGVNAVQIHPQAGDKYLMCSDGVTDGVTDAQIAEMLKRNDEPQKLVEDVIQLAQDGGSRDNITCVVLELD